MNTEYKKIKVEGLHGGQGVRFLLDSPKGNVLDTEMMAELTQAIEDAGKAADVKAVVFAGAGRHFSFGASVEEHQKGQVAGMLKVFHGLMRTLAAANKPAFALVRGQCLGGGMELAAFCNWIFASADAHFGQPEIQLGVFPPVASLILPHLIGQVAADDLTLSGRSVTAAEAHDMGLVYSVSEQPEAELETYLQTHILPKSAAALSFAVRASRHEMITAFLRNIDALEKMYVEELMESVDANEGIRSFLEKRKPVWQNR